MNEAMDDYFKYFYEDEGFGPAIETQQVSPEIIDKFRGKLPNQLLSYWALYGWSGYGKGLFWIVNPDEYMPVLDAWIGDTHFIQEDEYHVIARSAFGELLIWGKKSGQSLSITTIQGMIFPSDQSEKIASGEEDFLAKSFFVHQDKKTLDQLDELDRPLFERALKMYGPLGPDEMYGFEPALALGGKCELANLRKVKAVEHLVLLAQLGERKIMRDIVKDAKAHGLM